MKASGKGERVKEIIVAALQTIESLARLAEAAILLWLAHSELERRRREERGRKRQRHNRDRDEPPGD